MDKKTKDLEKRLRRYVEYCAVEIDHYNRAHDTEHTVGEVWAEAQKGQDVSKLLTYPNFLSYCEAQDPKRASKVARRVKLRESRSELTAHYYEQPLSVRLKHQATAELFGALLVHRDNLTQLEAEMALELEDDGMDDMGAF